MSIAFAPGKTDLAAYAREIAANTSGQSQVA